MRGIQKKMKYKLIDLVESEFETDDFEHEIRLGELEIGLWMRTHSNKWQKK